MKDKKIDFGSLDRKLTAIVGLLLKISNQGEKSNTKDQIRVLSSFGLTSKEISTVLCKKISHVSKELTGLKTKK